MIGRPDGDAVEARADQERNTAVRAPWKHQGQRAGPERPREGGRPFVEGDDGLGRVHAAHVDDKRIEPRAVLGREHGGHGAIVGGVGAQPVNGLGWKSHDLALAKQAAGLGDRVAGGVAENGMGARVICHASAVAPRTMKWGFSNPGFPYSSSVPSVSITDPPANRATA